jgi:hypothetical protein
MVEPVFTPDDVDAQWLTAVLREAGAADGEVVAIDTETIGAGKVGQNVRFTLGWDGDGPRTLVGKFPSTDPTSRAAGVALRNYEREVRFYEVLAGTVAVHAPRCHLAAFDPANGDFVLLLDDLAPAEVGDQLAGCTVDEAASAVDELVMLHAPRWGDASLGGIGDWLGPALVGGGEVIAQAYQAMLPGFLDRYGDALSPDAAAVAGALTDVVDRWVQPVDAPVTVTHNDYRLDNLLFGRDDTGGVSTAVVDWQTVGLGPGVGDVAYFIGAGLLVEDRRAVERELLERYRQVLVAAGMSLSAEEAWWQYRRTCPAGLVMAVFASTVVGAGERSDAMFVAMAERHAIQMLDVEALDTCRS